MILAVFTELCHKHFNGNNSLLSKVWVSKNPNSNNLDKMEKLDTNGDHGESTKWWLFYLKST